MGRIAELDRLPMVDAHLAHYAQANAAQGTPIELVPGFGLPQLQTLRDDYATRSATVMQIEQTTLPVLRAERDTIWGLSPSDDNGVWYWLSQYKAVVKARFGARSPLTLSVPNLGRVFIERYLEILHQFLDHWAMVDPGRAPTFFLGTKTRADFVTIFNNLTGKLTAISAAETNLQIQREEATQFFGDEPEELRLPTSIVSRLMLYHALIPVIFPNQPLADSLPEIFPPESAPSLPSFFFNWVTVPGGAIKTWFPDASRPSGAVSMFLKEGGLEMTAALVSSPPGGNQVHTWTGITVIDELDAFELRNAAGLTVANGTRDNAIPEPA